jgi:tetratricopeptide (TPR) repeat protein
VPINDYVIANEELADLEMEVYYPCCGKSICGGCIHSFSKSGNIGTCPFCNAERIGKTDEDRVKEVMNRVEAKDAGALCQLGCYYHNGLLGLQSDREKAIELWKQAAKLGSSQAHYRSGKFELHVRGDLKKAKFHYEAAAMAGHEDARFNLGLMEYKSGNVERAVKHWKIAASAGNHKAMYNLLDEFEDSALIRESVDSTLAAYNNSCAEMRSEARDAFIQDCR